MYRIWKRLLENPHFSCWKWLFFLIMLCKANAGTCDNTCLCCGRWMSTMSIFQHSCRKQESTWFHFCMLKYIKHAFCLLARVASSCTFISCNIWYVIPTRYRSWNWRGAWTLVLLMYAMMVETSASLLFCPTLTTTINGSTTSNTVSVYVMS